MPKKSGHELLQEKRTAPKLNILRRLDAEKCGLPAAILFGFIHCLMLLISATALDGGVLAGRYTIALTLIATLAGICFLLRVARLHTLLFLATIVSLFAFFLLMIIPTHE